MAERGSAAALREVTAPASMAFRPFLLRGQAEKYVDVSKFSALGVCVSSTEMEETLFTYLLYI